MSERDADQASPSPSDLTKLQIAHSLRDYHHKALWEEEKHFMWFVSIVLSADILLATTDKVGPRTQGWLILSLSLLGAVICLVALRVLRSESVNFQVAAYRFILQHNVCFNEPQLPQVDRTAANKSWRRLLADSLRGRATIRDAFQFLFVVFFVVFILAALAGIARTTRCVA